MEKKSVIQNIKEIEQSLREEIKRINLASLIKLPKIKMRHLVERWSPSVIILFLFVKCLQGLRALGFVSSEGGWRKAARLFLHKEKSKFVLAVFRLAYASDMQKRIAHMDKAEEHIIWRLMQFFKKHPSFFWHIDWRERWARQKKNTTIDLIYARFNQEGSLTYIRPYFDPEKVVLPKDADTVCAVMHHAVTRAYNELRFVPDLKRRFVLRKRLTRWIRFYARAHNVSARVMIHYIDRILKGTWIHFEMLQFGYEQKKELRFIDPPFFKRRHPGYGLMNIACRIHENFNEVDLWFQFDHVPVDGAPMQELLNELKREWGTIGELRYPSLKGTFAESAQRLENEMVGGGMHHIRLFLDFRSFLAVRKRLNERFFDILGMPIPAIAMLMWGLSHHECLCGKKFIFPVDIESTGAASKNRAPSVVTIRPSHYFKGEYADHGFIQYINEFNRRLHATRARHSETYELLELYALTSPLIYALTRRFMPRALGEFVGTVGITMIRDAEIFRTPVSDIHHDGFFAFSNFCVHTENEEQAGSVSICAPQEKIIAYVEALEHVVSHFEEYIPSFSQYPSEPLSV